MPRSMQYTERRKMTAKIFPTNHCSPSQTQHSSRLRLALRAPFTLALFMALGVGASCRTSNNDNTSNGLQGNSGGGVQWPTGGDATVESDASSAANGAMGTECVRDQDCVPAECCHPRTCVPAAQRTAVCNMMCTEECRGGTMDCGGGCLCQQGRCAAHITDRGLGVLFTSDAGR